MLRIYYPKYLCRLLKTQALYAVRHANIKSLLISLFHMLKNVALKTQLSVCHYETQSKKMTDTFELL